MGFLYLAGAITAVGVGSSMMKLTTMVKSKKPILMFIIGYAIEFYLLSLALFTIHLSFAYALWSGVGTALTAIVVVFIFKEKINVQTAIGIMLIIIGLVCMRL